MWCHKIDLIRDPIMIINVTVSFPETQVLINSQVEIVITQLFQPCLACSAKKSFHLKSMTMCTVSKFIFIFIVCKFATKSRRSTSTYN